MARRRFTEFIKSRSKDRADARDVSRLLLRVANDPNPKLRYLIGKGTSVQVWLRRLLPWHRYEKMIAKAVKID